MEELENAFTISEKHIFHESKWPKTRIAFIYLTSVGLIGVVWIALLVSLSDLAEKAGSTEGKAIYVLYAKGIGGLLAATSSGYFYDNFNANNVLSAAMIVFIILLISLGLNTSLVMLYVYYFLFGLTAVLIDTGSIISLIHLFEINAGPWIGAGAQISIYLYASIAAFIDIYTSNVEYEFLLFIVFPVFCLIALQVLNYDIMINGTTDKSTITEGFGSQTDSDIEKNSKGKSSKTEKLGAGTRGDEQSPLLPKPNHNTELTANDQIRAETNKDMKIDHHYYAEIIICIALLINVGSISFFVTYLSTYTAETNTMDTTEESYMLFACFCMAFISKFFLIFDQLYFVNNESLPYHIYVVAIVSTIAAIVSCVYPTFNITLWVATCIIGFFGTNIPPLLFDLLNRSTNASATSVTIAYLGVILGETFMPPLLYLMYEAVAWKGMFMLVLLIANACQIPLVFLIIRVSYIYNPPAKLVV